MLLDEIQCFREPFWMAQGALLSVVAAEVGIQLHEDMRHNMRNQYVVQIVGEAGIIYDLLNEFLPDFRILQKDRLDGTVCDNLIVGRGKQAAVR